MQKSERETYYMKVTFAYRIQIKLAMPMYARKKRNAIIEERKNMKEKQRGKEEFIPQIISLLSLKIFGP